MKAFARVNPSVTVRSMDVSVFKISARSNRTVIIIEVVPEKGLLCPSDAKKKVFLTVHFLCALFVYWQPPRIL